MNLNARCSICRKTKGEHLLVAGGAFMCPPLPTYFTECMHHRRQGVGMLSSDGHGGSDETCMDCGARIVTGCYADVDPIPPQSDRGEKQS